MKRISLTDIILIIMWIVTMVIDNMNLSGYLFNLDVIANILFLGVLLYVTLHTYKVKRFLIIIVFIVISLLIGSFVFISKVTPSLERYLPWVSITLLFLLLIAFITAKIRGQQI